MRSPKKLVNSLSVMLMLLFFASAVHAAKASSAASSPAAMSTSKASKAKHAEAAAGSVTAQTPPKPGMVWVNSKTKVFHTEGDRYYGKTKNGKWMTEEDAVKAGYHKSKQDK